MAGAAAGTTARGTSAPQAPGAGAYTGLRDLLRRALARQGRSDVVLDAVESQPGTWHTDLSEALTATRADQDAQVLAAARALLAAADPAGTAADKYTIDVSDATGVQ